MLRKLFKVLFLSFSLCGFSCVHNGPKIDVCLPNIPNTEFKCVNKLGEEYSLDFKDPKINDLIAIPTEDFGVLLNYCKAKKD